jgi:HK97 family phage major capsid protein
MARKTEGTFNMTIKVLRDKKAALLTEANLLSAKEAAGTISAEESTRYEAMLADGGEISVVNAQISRAERLMDEQRRSGTVVEDPNASQEQRDKQAKKFKSLGEQMMAVARADLPNKRVDDRLQWNGSAFAGPTGASEGVASDGGFLVQSDFAAGLLENTFNSGEIASRIRKIQVGANSNGIKMNGVDETSRVNGSRGAASRHSGLVKPS